LAKEEAESWGFATRALHIGQGPDPATGAVVQPIHLATTFAQQGVGKHKGYEYSRSGNPTRSALEECLAGLEGAGTDLPSRQASPPRPRRCSCSARAITSCTWRTFTAARNRLFDKVLKRFGLNFSAVDASDLEAVERAISPATKLVWLESPTNPLLRSSTSTR